MPERLKNSRKLVGVKQAKRALSEDRAALCFIALDAEKRVTAPLRELCLQKGVEVVDVGTMAALGEYSGIETGAAAAVIEK